MMCPEVKADHPSSGKRPKMRAISRLSPTPITNECYHFAMKYNSQLFKVKQQWEHWWKVTDISIFMFESCRSGSKIEEKEVGERDEGSIREGPEEIGSSCFL